MTVKARPHPSEFHDVKNCTILAKIINSNSCKRSKTLQIVRAVTSMRVRNMPSLLSQGLSKSDTLLHAGDAAWSTRVELDHVRALADLQPRALLAVERSKSHLQSVAGIKKAEISGQPEFLTLVSLEFEHQPEFLSSLSLSLQPPKSPVLSTRN